MTLEEALNRIAKLEAENEKLRTGDKPKRIERSPYPDEWLKLHPIFSDFDIEHQCTKDKHLTNIGAVIRNVVFHETENKTHCRCGKFRVQATQLRYIMPIQMSDSQYQLYIRTFENVLKSILDGRSEAVNSKLSGWSIDSKQDAESEVDNGDT